jgi:hypothetical protein
MRYITFPKIEVRLLFAATKFPDCVSFCSNVDDDDDDGSYLIVKFNSKIY